MCKQSELSIWSLIQYLFPEWVVEVWLEAHKKHILRMEMFDKKLERGV
jgi:hypothetical protein